VSETPQNADILIRPGVEEDLAALTALYNHYVRETPATFDTEPFTPQERRPWLLSHPEDGPHRLLVACGGADGQILGYTTSSSYRAKPAYATSVETSVYIAPHAVGQGLGTLLYARLFELLRGQDLHRAYAGIALPNDASVRLHERLGFASTGTHREVGRKFGRYYDVGWFEKPLSP
jgi:phosphinothricin acetyltransferase